MVEGPEKGRTAQGWTALNGPTLWNLLGRSGSVLGPSTRAAKCFALPVVPEVERFCGRLSGSTAVIHGSYEYRVNIHAARYPPTHPPAEDILCGRRYKHDRATEERDDTGRNGRRPQARPWQSREVGSEGFRRTAGWLV